MSNLPAEIPGDFGSAIALLGQRQRLGVEDMKLMILLETAGDPLYQKLAELVDHPEAKALLQQNGREETAHAHRLKNAIEILTGGRWLQRLPGRLGRALPDHLHRRRYGRVRLGRLEGPHRQAWQQDAAGRRRPVRDQH
jgi:hypothetical protein